LEPKKITATSVERNIDKDYIMISLEGPRITKKYTINSQKVLFVQPRTQFADN